MSCETRNGRAHQLPRPRFTSHCVCLCAAPASKPAKLEDDDANLDEMTTLEMPQLSIHVCGAVHMCLYMGLWL